MALYRFHIHCTKCVKQSAWRSFYLENRLNKPFISFITLSSRTTATLPAHPHSFLIAAECMYILPLFQSFVQPNDKKALESIVICQFQWLCIYSAVTGWKAVHLATLPATSSPSLTDKSITYIIFNRLPNNDQPVCSCSSYLRKCFLLVRFMRSPHCHSCGEPATLEKALASQG